MGRPEPGLNIGFIRKGRFKSLLECPESAASTAEAGASWLEVLVSTLGTMSSHHPGDVCCCCASSTELPVVEKLQLSESMESSGEEQELVEEEELRRFRELKHKMILLDEAELGSATPANNRRLFPATNR